MANTYPPEIKAQAIAAWLAGTSVRQIAKEFGAPPSTIQNWIAAHPRTAPVRKTNLIEADDLDSMALDLVNASVRSLEAILAASQDPSWITRFSPADAAILFGVISDKFIRLVSAIKPIESVHAYPATDSPG